MNDRKIRNLLEYARTLADEAGRADTEEAISEALRTLERELPRVCDPGEDECESCT